MQIARGLYSMQQERGGHVHAFLVDGGDGLTLVDTLYDGDANVILAELDAMGKTPRDIKRILLTHAHKSHISGLAAIQRMSGAPVYASETEIPIIEGRAKATPVGFDLPKPFNARVYGLQVALNLGIGRHEPTKVDVRLQEGGSYGPLVAVAAPGHTPGSMAFWWADRRILIAGDAIATWPQLDAGWRSFNLDDAAALHSVQNMAQMQPEIVCVGHGEPITDGAADKLRELVQE